MKIQLKMHIAVTWGIWLWGRGKLVKIGNDNEAQQTLMRPKPKSYGKSLSTRCVWLRKTSNLPI